MTPHLNGKTFGGSGDDQGMSIQETSDGGYVIAGFTNSMGSGGYDAYIIKTDQNGNLVASKTFGGIGNDFAFSVGLTSDGGFITTGIYNAVNVSSTTDPAFPVDLSGDLFLRKMNANLELEWEKTIKEVPVVSPTFPYAMGYSVQQTGDGGYIVAGASGTGGGGGQTYLVKTDASGNVQWDVLLDGELGTSVRETSDGYIVSMQGGPLPEVGLTKVDKNGATLWTATFPANGIISANIRSVWVTSDGGYVVTGDVSQSNGDIYLAKTSANGILLWEKNFGSSGGDIGYSVQETTDQGLIITGFGNLTENNTRFNVYLGKTDNSGNIQWQRGFAGAGDEGGFSVRQTSDGGYVIVGRTDSIGSGGNDVYLLKTDADGTPLW